MMKIACTMTTQHLFNMTIIKHCNRKTVQKNKFKIAVQKLSDSNTITFNIIETFTTATTGFLQNQNMFQGCKLLPAAFLICKPLLFWTFSDLHCGQKNRDISVSNKDKVKNKDYCT